MDDDISVFEKYQLAEQFRDPKKCYNPDKDDGGPRWQGDKDKDKDKKEKKKPNITVKRVLVRNEDGTMGVEFIDVKTGYALFKAQCYQGAVDRGRSICRWRNDIQRRQRIRQIRWNTLYTGRQ